MLREPVTDLVAEHRQEVLAIVVLVNFGLAFALATTIDVGTTARASVFLLSFAAIGVAEYVAACRWCAPRVRSLAYWTG
jgi:hypothetical protein